MLWPRDFFPAISTNILLRSCFWIETAQGGRGEAGGNIASSLRKFMKMTRLTDSLPKFPLTVNKCQDRGDSSLSYPKTVQAFWAIVQAFMGCCPRCSGPAWVESFLWSHTVALLEWTDMSSHLSRAGHAINSLFPFRLAYSLAERD